MAEKTARSATKKSSAKKSPTKKSPTKKSPTKKSASQDGQDGTSSRRAEARAESRRPARASQVAASAAQELLELTGKQAEGVTGLERVDDGWIVQVEVVEVRRIPDTTDVLALYEVSTDGQGNLQGYRRLRRYARGVPGDD